MSADTGTERIRRLRALYDELTDLAPAERALQLATLARTEPALAREIEQLLALAETASDPAAAAVARAVDAFDAPRLPARIGPYRILRQLGEGGMGVVLLGERADGEFVKQVAIKLIRGFGGERMRAHLKRERQLLAQLEHPNIARLYDGGATEAGEPYLVLEYVDGERLSAWLARTPSLEARLRLFAGLCRAVHFAHQRLVIHCDIKPCNVMVRADGSPVLLDFGIARLLADAGDGASATGTLLATPAYASPEQLAHRPLSSATDVYALGLVLYELLAGRLPPREASATDAELPPPSRMLGVAGEPATRELARKLRGDLDRIVRLAVRQEPAARYASAAAFAADIEAWLEGRPVQAAGQAWTYLVGRFVRRHRFAVAAFVAALALIVGLALWLALALEQAHEAEATARRAATAAEQSTVFLEDLFGGLDPRVRAGQPLDLDSWLERGRARIDRLAESPEARQRLLSSLARVEVNLGRHERGLALLDQSEAIAVAKRSPEQALAARLLRSRALAGLSRYPDARAEASAALAEAERLGLDAAAAEALVARGIAAMTLGDYEAAGADYDAAERRFAALGDEEGSASIAINRSIVAEYRGDYAAAHMLALTARAHSRAKHGPDHPSALDAQFAEGKLLAYLGRNVEAVPVLADLLARCERVFGPASSQTQRAVAELATTLQRTGRYSEALAAYERALAIARALYGTGDHVQVSNHHANIAAALEERGEFTRAAELLTESAAMRERLFGAASPRRANALHALARGALAVGDLAAANRYADEALAIRRQALPEHDPWRLMSEALALEIAIARGELAGAEAEMARLETAIVARPEMELRTRIAILRAAAALAAARGDHAARLAALRREFELRAETYAPATHAVILDVRLRLAAALLAAGDTPGAKLELEAILPHAGEAFVAGAPQWQRLSALERALARAE